MNLKTTICGILAIVAAGVTNVATPLLDSNPATAADWTAFSTAIVTGLGMIFAADGAAVKDIARRLTSRGL